MQNYRGARDLTKNRSFSPTTKKKSKMTITRKKKHLSQNRNEEKKRENCFARSVFFFPCLFIYVLLNGKKTTQINQINGKKKTPKEFQQKHQKNA
jgi:hypothetical protein